MQFTLFSGNPLETCSMVKPDPKAASEIVNDYAIGCSFEIFLHPQQE
jgi:hypothetical protein